MKQWGIIAAFLVFVGVFVVHTPRVFAHFPATDKKMTVTLHIDPNDQAFAGQPTTLHFIYNDQLGKFSKQKCNCRVSIDEQGRQLFSAQTTPITGSSVYGNYVTYTFPKPDVYSLNLSGNPKQTGDFVPFTVSWNVRVIPSPNNPNNSSENTPFYIIGFVVLMLGLGSVIGYIIYKDFRDA